MCARGPNDNDVCAGWIECVLRASPLVRNRKRCIASGATATKPNQIPERATHISGVSRGIMQMKSTALSRNPRCNPSLMRSTPHDDDDENMFTCILSFPGWRRTHNVCRPECHLTPSPINNNFRSRSNVIDLIGHFAVIKHDIREMELTTNSSSSRHPIKTDRTPDRMSWKNK